MKIKKLTALLLSAVLVLGLTGCIGNLYENVCTVDGTDISAGLYQMAQYSAYNEALNKRADTEKSVWDQKIEDKNATDWVRDRTEVLVRRYVAVQRLARTHGVSVSTEGQESIEQLMSYWYILEENYTKMGVAQQTVYRYMSNEDLGRQLMQKVYAEGGELYVPDDELRQAYSEKYARLSFLTIPTTTSDGADLKDEVLAELDKILAALDGGKTMADVAGGKEFVDLYKLLERDYDATTGADGIQKSYLAYEQDNNQLYSEEFLASLREEKVGDFGYYLTMDGARVILYERIPTFADDSEFADMRSNIITDLKTDEYEAWLAEIYDAYPVDWALGARWYFGPKSVGS